eukprot:2136286-Prymnesium_polylepis.1
MPLPSPRCPDWTLSMRSRRLLFLRSASANTFPSSAPSEVRERSSEASVLLILSPRITGSTLTRKLPASDREVRQVFRWTSAPIRWPSSECRSTPDEKSRLVTLPLSSCTGNADLNSTNSRRLEFPHKASPSASASLR